MGRVMRPYRHRTLLPRIGTRQLDRRLSQPSTVGFRYVAVGDRPGALPDKAQWRRPLNNPQPPANPGRSWLNGSAVTGRSRTRQARTSAPARDRSARSPRPRPVAKGAIGWSWLRSRLPGTADSRRPLPGRSQREDGRRLPPRDVHPVRHVRGFVPVRRRHGPHAANALRHDPGGDEGRGADAATRRGCACPATTASSAAPRASTSPTSCTRSRAWPSTRSPTATARRPASLACSWARWRRSGGAGSWA